MLKSKRLLLLYSVKRTRILLSSYPQHHSTLRYVTLLYVTYRHKLIILEVFDIQFAVNPSS